MSDNIIFMGTSKFAVPILEKISEANSIFLLFTHNRQKNLAEE